MTRIVVSVPGVTFDNMLFGDGWQLGELEGWWDTTKPRIVSDARPEWHGDFGQDEVYLEPRFVTVSGVFQSRENPDLVTSARDVLAALHEAGEFEFMVSDGAVGRVTARMASELAWDVDYAPGCAAFEFTVKADDPRRYGAGQSFGTGVPTQGVGVADPVVDPVQEGGVLVPVATNLFTNPRLKGDGTYAEIARNLFTNPNLVGDGTWAEVRRNYFVNPLVTSVGGFSVTGGQGTVSAVSGAVRFTASSSSWFELRADSGTFPVSTAGRVLMRVRASKALTATARLRAGSGVNVSLGTSWAWINVTVTSGTGATNLSGLSLTPTSGHAAGDWVEIDRVLYAVAPDSGPFFDPSAPFGSVDPDMRQRFVGAIGNSESVMEGERVAGLTASRCVAIVSTKAGKPAVRQIPTDSASTDSFISIGIPAGAARTSGTMLGTVHLDAPLTGALYLSRRLGAVAFLPEQATLAPNTAGSHPVRNYYPTALTSAYQARWYHGGLKGSGDVWWTDIGVFADDYHGEYFHGSYTPGASSLTQPEDFRWRWLGAMNASESVMEFEMVATKIGDNGSVYLPGLASEAWPEGGTSLRVLGDVPVRVGDQLDPYESVPLPGVQVSAIQLGDPATPAWLAGIGSGVMWDTGKIRWTAGQPVAQGSYGAVLRTTGGTNPVSLYGSFKFTGTRFALMMTSWAETDVTVYVDHRAVTPTAYPTLTQGTGHQLVVIEGLGAGAHTVDFCIGWASNFVQVLCELPLSVEPGPQPAFRLGLLGDSYADSGIQPYYGGLARELHRLTGWSIYQLGQGSTGYTNDGSSSGDSSKSVYGSPSRVAAANGAACDAVLIIGSVNDGAASPATVAQACEDLVNELDAPVIIAGVEPLSLPGDPGTAWNAVNDMLMVMASSLVPVAGGGVIDWRGEDWLTGTGSVSDPKGDGNQDIYIGDAAGTDTVHANIEGQMYLADRFVAAMTPMTLVRRGVEANEYAIFPEPMTGSTLVLRAESPSQFALTIGDEPERLHPDGDGIVRVSDAAMVILSAGRWTDIGVFAGDYDGPAFSGSTPPDTIGGASYTHQWDGGVDASTSTRYWIDTGTPGNPGRVALTNTGTAPSEPMVRVTGGLSEGFELLCIETGDVVRVTRPIPDGSVIDVDMGAGQVWIDQQSPLSAMYVPVAEWFSVKPGHTCTIQFTPFGVVTGTPTMSVEFAEASW